MKLFVLSIPLKRSLLIFFILITSNLYAADYYWVGGSGNWSDLNHWRLGSTAGSIPSIVPSTADNVFFTSGSGFVVGSKTVTLDNDGFCNNMTWTGVTNSPVFNRASTTFILEAWGNIVFSPTTTYSVQFDLKGGTPNTLTTGGNALGAFVLNIDKPGGGITVTDSLVCPAAAQIYLVSGNFDIAGKKLYSYVFGAAGSNPRTIDFSNSNVTVTYSYNITGANKTVNAAGSTVNALGYIWMDNTVYNKVTNNARDAANFSIYNCTFSTITFLYGGYGWDARIHDGNTADTIRFMGTGSIGSNNNVNVIIGLANISVGNNNTVDTLISAGGLSIGTGNTISRVESGPVGGGAGGMVNSNSVGYWKHNGQFTVSGTLTNTVDSLLLTPSKIITFRGTFNINKYLELNGNTCDAFSEVSGDSIAGSINFAPGATANLNNMTLTGVKAYGPITPLTVAGIDNGENVGFIITPPAAAGTTLYWVGGAGDWNDRSHWSNTSGGASGACVPYIGDNVVFDANSGLATGTITTSSTSFCNNMTWTGVGNVTFSESASYKFNLYGSLVMDNTVTMNALVEMVGSANAGITTNGTTIGSLQFIISKTGSGTVTLNDNWSNPTLGSFVHRSGGLNLSGRTVNIAIFTSTINSVRSLDITNATLNFTNYDYRGTGKTIASTGSHITAANNIAVDGLNYPWIDANYAGTGGAFEISNTTIGQLTFNATGTTVNAYIRAGNTIRRLEYKGRGVITAGGNTIDSLILAGSRNYFFGGTNTITKYLKAQSTPCAGLSEIRNYTPAGTTGTFAFSAGAVVDMGNVYMQNMTATGPITPIAFNGADAGGNTGWVITAAAGGPRYWIGGSGDWNDNTHWSATSGGASGACIPTVYDDVYFDANSSFTAVSKTITINNGNAYAHNINWTGATNNPIWSKSATWTLEVWGDSLITIPAATFNVSPLVLKGSNTIYMKGAAPAGNFDIQIDKTGSGGLTLLNDYSSTGTDFGVLNGAFNASGKTLNVANITNGNFANVSSMNISNANITTAGWNYTNTVANHTLNAANSVINTATFASTGLTYNKVNVSGTAAAHAQLTGTTIDSLVFTDPGTASAVGINGANNNLNYVEYKGSGGIYGTGNIIDTLLFFPGNNYILNASTNTTITGEWFGSGTPCRLTQIYSSSATVNATVTKTSGNVDFDYVRLRRITAAGPAIPFNAREHTDNQGNNINWTIAPYNGAAPIYGLGPDTAIAITNFPAVLHTDGFFGSPSSQYTWNNGSTADSLIITGPGTYSVTVFFPDGCSISDNIIVTYASILPITLISFDGQLQDCQSQLTWKTANSIGFKHFIIEKSRDGRNFSSIGEVIYKESLDTYSFTDKNTSNGNNFYRLRLVDADGRYSYSSIVKIQCDCEEKSIQVYPTLTNNKIWIALPQTGYEKARIYIINVAGQRIIPVVNLSGSLKTIDLQGLPAATYVLQVITDKEAKSFKIIKQ